MILWTIQPVEIYNLVIETGVYRCDPALIHLPEFADSYSWLAKQMTDRIGPAPAGVTFPVWAWYIMDGKRKKPDLRRERWTGGPGNEDFARIEIEVPDQDVLLSDFDAWGSILSNWLLSDTEEEYEQQKAFYTQMSPLEQKSRYGTSVIAYPVREMKNGLSRRTGNVISPARAPAAGRMRPSSSRVI